MRIRLQDWLTFQADRRPEATAVVMNAQATSYAELDQASNRMARALQAAGCIRGDRVALLLPKSPKALMAMFGALKADCIYVPIDPSGPVARVERILAACECRCLVAEQSTAGLLRGIAQRSQPGALPAVLWTDEGAGVGGAAPSSSWREIETLPGAYVDSWNSPSDAAHILFTSGSTGTPKGVVITHSNVAHFVRWALRYFRMGPDDRISGHPPLHFDLSTFDVYGTIAAGAQIHLLPPELSLIPHRLADFIRSAELTQWFSVPSALLPIAKFNALRPNDFPALKRLLWCGEKFPTPALKYWMERLPHVAFVNLYGPTEATIASSYYSVPRVPEDACAEIPIGQACAGESLLILDDQGNPVAPGDIGNLYIGGVGLSPGYWGDPDKTAEVFGPHPRGTDSSERIYKTGDLAKTGPSGMIYLVGRCDSQIKSRGYRIELGEIETALHAVPGIQDGAVVAIDSEDGDNRIICCAYAVSPGCELTPADLKRRFAAVLPSYMIPARWMTLAALPHNGNGKTDRVAIKNAFRRQEESVVAESQIGRGGPAKTALVVAG